MRFSHLFLFIFPILLTGCSSSSPGNSSPAHEFKVILITDVGGLGDKGFNDSGWAGCQLAQKTLAQQGKSIDVQFIESEEQTDYIANLSMAAERADVVIALGFLIADAVENVAGHFPDTKFIFIDGEVKGGNVASFVFNSNEAAFLAGLLVSYVSRTGVVGIMPGMDIPPVESFAAGFRAGVGTGGGVQGKDIKILSTTIGSFDDPVKAKSIAVSLLDQKADIILQLAGNSGLGVIEAVKDSPERVFAVGVDIDQDDLVPGKILTSILKRMDQVVSDQIAAAYEEHFQGGIFHVGLKENAVGLTDMRHTRQLVPKEVWQLLDHARTSIGEQKITIPNTYALLDAFAYRLPPLESGEDHE